MNKKHSLDFGKKEKVLNYACQTYQLSRPGKVGAVMSLIRECQPHSIEEWEQWYFENAYTEAKTKNKITKESLQELGERLYEKITEIVIPEWEAAFRQLTLQDCIDYVFNLTINRTFDGFLREKSVVNDGLAKIFTDIVFEESDPELDHSGNIDYVAKIGKRMIGIQIKPITAKANIAGYSMTERMEASFKSFEEEFGGKVFTIFSKKKKIVNIEVIDEINIEIERLKECE